MSSYREIAGTEVVDTTDERGTAREKDIARKGGFTSVNPRAAERLGTALFLYSVSPRPRGQQGATDAELKAATFVPDGHYDPSDADVVFAELQDQENGFVTLDTLAGPGRPARHYFSTRQTINMLIRAQRAMVSDVERDKVLADRAWSLVKAAPFNAAVRVETPPDTDNLTPLEILKGAGLDEARKTRLVVLDPRRFSLLNGVDQETKTAVRAALGLGEDKLPVAWASSAVFVCVNTQRRSQARNLASEYEARLRVSTLDAVKGDAELKAKADAEVTDALKRFDKAIRGAFQHIIYLKEGADGARSEGTIRLDGDNETALHGDIVWAALDEVDKAFGYGEFDTKALLEQLRDSDYGRPLSELRDSFWNTPRLPLLPSGERELRAAVLGAVRAGDLVLTDAAGNAYTAHSEAEINLQSNTIRLVKAGAPAAVTVPSVVGLTVEDAAKVLSDVVLTVLASGSGTVANQSPSAGTQLDPGSAVTLTLVGAGGLGGAGQPEYQVKNLDDHQPRRHGQARRFASSCDPDRKRHRRDGEPHPTYCRSDRRQRREGKALRGCR